MLFAYQTSPHTATKKLPFYRVYGREAQLPVELEIPSSTTECMSEGQELTYRCEAFTKLHLERTTTADNIKNSQKLQRKYHDAQVYESPFTVGDNVLAHNTRKRTRKGRKLDPK